MPRPQNDFDIILPVLHHQSVTSVWCSHPCLLSDFHRTATHPNALVVASSPLHMRNAVYKLGSYFRREFEYDAVGFSVKSQEKYRAFIWTRELFHTDKYDRLAIGATVFYPGEKFWTLSWIWFHPFSRRGKLLTKSWGYFREKFGEFHVDTPVSYSMGCFLIKQKYEGPKYSYRELLESKTFKHLKTE